MATATATAHPMLFSAPMVQAILADHKTMTRRAVKAKAHKDGVMLKSLMDSVIEWRTQDDTWFGIEGCDTLVSARCPYGKVGDTIWVRETWQDSQTMNIQAEHHAVYRATDPDWESYENWKWRPSIFMPRWASRITLQITDIRVEKLSDISEQDAIAEGFSETPICNARACFRDLWATINGTESLASNPWTWVVSFSRIKP